MTIDTTHCSVCGQDFGESKYKSNIYDIYEVHTDAESESPESDEEILVLCYECFRAGMATLRIFYPRKVIEK